MNSSDSDPYVSFAKLCAELLRVPPEIGVRYVGGDKVYPKLGERLRFSGERSDIESVRIHADDASKFVSRVRKWELWSVEPLQVAVYVNESTGECFTSRKLLYLRTPPGFVATPFTLPIATRPSMVVPDGIIAMVDELLATYYEKYVLVRNPVPEFDFMFRT